MNPASASPNLATRQFFLGCLRACLPGSDQPAPALPAAPDWELFLKLAAFHRVAPLLERALRLGRLPELPAPVHAGLENLVRANSTRGLLLTAELARLLKGWGVLGIQALPFKGPSLALQLYNDPTLRHYDDLDVFVRQADFPAARAHLVSLGYQPQPPEPGEDFHETFKLPHPDRPLEVELHWSLLPENRTQRLAPETFWARCATVTVGGASALALAPEDLLLFLCLHGSKHGWNRLLWLCDVTQLLRHHPQLDWDSLLSRARQAQGWRMLLLGLFLARELLNAPLSPEIEQSLRREPAVARLAEPIKHRHYHGPVDTFVKPWQVGNFNAQLEDSSLGRFTDWLRRLVTPTVNDLNSVQLPRALYPVYYLIRPFRLLGKSGSMAARQVFGKFIRTKES